MKKQSTTQELKIEEAYNAFPFEVPSLKWEEGTGYYLENPSAEELENLARFFEDEPVHSTQLEVEIERWIKDKRLINAATRTLQTKGGLVYTTTNDFSDKNLKLKTMKNMKTYKFWELDGEQKIDALEKIIYMDSIWIDKHDTQSLAKEIEDGYAVDDHFIFQVEEEGFVNVIQK